MRWLGYVANMSNAVERKIYKSDVEGRRDRYRPCTKRLDGVKKMYTARSLEFRNTKLMCMEKRNGAKLWKVQSAM